jgi:hypothetical protein
MTYKIPSQGFMYWPVGTGDSTTIITDDETFFQLDLHHLEMANDDDDPHTPIVDELVKILPKQNRKPYLSVLALTHPDLDHCKGFDDLLNRVTIGELWFTPRIFREYKKDLCDDAVSFKEEAERRVKKTIRNNGSVGSGDRVRIIGYDDLLEEEEYKGFPKNQLSVPGTEVTSIDGDDHSSTFRAFIHAPFKDDAENDRNDTSLAMQITLFSGSETGQALFFGDHSYPTLRRIFDVSEADDLGWHLFLAPHHCSKSAMYWKDEGSDTEKLKQDILDDIQNNQLSPNNIISSSEPIPASNQSGDNPPHAKAKARYQEITETFLCTQEHPNKKNPQPIVFSVTADGIFQEDSQGEAEASAMTLSIGIDRARGSSQPPQEKVGFGK